MEAIFFDTDGWGWVTCGAEAEGAVHFGPAYTARPVHHFTRERLHISHVPQEAVYHSNGWDMLDGPGWNEEGRVMWG
jgi:hypothetical protein